MLFRRSLNAKIDHVQVGVSSWSWPIMREKRAVSGHVYLCAQRSDEAMFVHPSVAAVSGGSGSPNLNRGQECHPGTHVI